MEPVILVLGLFAICIFGMTAETYIEHRWPTPKDKNDDETAHLPDD
jgi:hypothetical protein